MAEAVEWAEMSARERDALVAQKVMGEIVTWRTATVGGVERKWPTEHGIMCRYYTTDIAAAWEVVERMEQLGWRFDLSTYQAFTMMTGVDFEHITSDGLAEATCETAPEAICVAALRAVGVDVA